MLFMSKTVFSVEDQVDGEDIWDFRILMFVDSGQTKHKTFPFFSYFKMYVGELTFFLLLIQMCVDKIYMMTSYTM